MAGRQAQRYRASYCLDVRVVHDLWNQDKHRLVRLWGIRFGNEDLRLPKTMASDCVIGIDRRVPHDGAIVLTMTCGSPHPQMKMMGEISSALAFRSGIRRRLGGGGHSLWDTGRTVGDVVRKLTGAIGNQTAPISLAIWTAGPSYPARH